MRITRLLLLPLLLLVALVSPVSAALGSAGSTTAPTVRTAATKPVAVKIIGAVTTPESLTLADLAALPQQTQTVTYSSAGVPVTTTFTGPLLTDVLAQAGLKTDPAIKNDAVRFAIRARATDGYQAVVSYGEISADFGNTPSLLALTQDGATLDRPRLTVPGDGRGGRYVTGVVQLAVFDLGTRAGRVVRQATWGSDGAERGQDGHRA